jgi:hypothetical protein
MKLRRQLPQPSRRQQIWRGCLGFKGNHRAGLKLEFFDSIGHSRRVGDVRVRSAHPPKAAQETISQITIFAGATTATVYFSASDRMAVIPTDQAAQLIDLLSFA